MAVGLKSETVGRHRRDSADHAPRPPRARWRERPRDPVWTWGHRSWLILIFVFAFLFWGGAAVLFGAHQSFRLGGAMALTGGCLAGWLLVRHLKRPVDDRLRQPWWRYL
jgi:hypothetical protein